MFLTNEGAVPLLITRGIPRLHQAIIVVEISQFIQVQRMSGSRFPLFDHPFDFLPILTRRKGFWSEIKSAHLNPMGLREYHPITVKSLTVRGYQKHPFTLTNLLPEEHSIHTRDTPQEIGNGHMTNTNKLLGG